MKSNTTGLSSWDDVTYNDGNPSGFGAVPTGYFHLGAAFFARTFQAAFWEATEKSATSGRYAYMNETSKLLGRIDMPKNSGFSVRCLNDTIQQGACAGKSLAANEFCDSRDGTVYKSVQIGSQTWMAQNLNYGTFVHDNNMNGFTQEGAMKFCSINTQSNCAVEGGLYQWHTSMGIDSYFADSLYAIPSGNVRGICPMGWHMPKGPEWDSLKVSLGGALAAGSKTRLNNTTYSTWNTTFNDGNSSGFSAYPAGSRDYSRYWINHGSEAVFWEASQPYKGTGALHQLSTSMQDFLRSGYPKRAGHSVRCVKD